MEDPAVVGVHAEADDVGECSGWGECEEPEGWILCRDDVDAWEGVGRGRLLDCVCASSCDGRFIGCGADWRGECDGYACA